MATKRPHAATTPTTHPSRAAQVPSEPSRKKRKQTTRPTNLGAHSYKKAHTVNDLKATIRSLTRLLTHDDAAAAAPTWEKKKRLPATVRVEKERALATAEGELAAAERAKGRSEVIGRWHKVRFFERQRGGKRWKRLRKEAAEGEAGEAVERALAEAEVDVNYAQFFPLEREYVPLWPRRRGKGGEGEEGEGEGEYADGERRGDGEMWELVRRCMVDGRLEELRNGTLPELNGGEEVVEEKELVEEPAEEGTRKKRKTEKKEKEPKRKAKVEMRQEEQDDEESDGGFFE